MTMRRFPLILAVIALSVTAACASPDADPGVPPAASAPASVPAATSPAAAEDPGIPVPDPTGKTDGKPVEVTVTGQVTAGVEPGCRLISDGRNSYLLLGGDESVAKVGAQVTVTGRIGEGMMTTCQQGTPLQVTSVKAS